jgi:predicted O-methyltransferase YrrM
MSEALNNYVAWSWKRREELTNLVFSRTNGSVFKGPFQGMKILPKWSWGDGDSAGKLLGLYECELFESIEYEIAHEPDLVLNIGSAEGYYGIGFGMRTSAQIVLVDVQHPAIGIARENAQVNKVNKIQFSTDSSVENFRSYLSKYKKPLIFMDCEGYEEDFLDLEKIPELVKTSVIVESHDCIRPGLTDELIARFKDTHQIESIRQGAKNPYIDIIDDLSDYDKVLLCCEARPSTMTWLHMIPLS